MPLLVVLFVGCRHASPAPATIVAGAGDGACLDRLISRARGLGLMESDVDADKGFFRVEIQTQKGRKAQAMAGSGYFLNVQCSPDGATATVTAYTGSRKPAARIRKELAAVTEQLEGF